MITWSKEKITTETTQNIDHCATETALDHRLRLEIQNKIEIMVVKAAINRLFSPVI